MTLRIVQWTTGNVGQRSVHAVVKRPEVIEKMQSYGYAAEGSTPERLLEINRDDLALWRKLITDAGLELD